jgi:hypothetical protein
MMALRTEWDSVVCVRYILCPVLIVLSHLMTSEPLVSQVTGWAGVGMILLTVATCRRAFSQQAFGPVPLPDANPPAPPPVEHPLFDRDMDALPR